MENNGSFERSAGRETVGALEVHSVTEGDAFERIDFSGEDTAIGAIEDCLAVDEGGWVGGVLPEGFLTNVWRQNIEPGAIALTGGSECG